MIGIACNMKIEEKWFLKNHFLSLMCSFIISSIFMLDTHFLGFMRPKELALAIIKLPNKRNGLVPFLCFDF